MGASGTQNYSLFFLTLIIMLSPNLMEYLEKPFQETTRVHATNLPTNIDLSTMKDFSKKI